MIHVARTATFPLGSDLAIARISVVAMMMSPIRSYLMNNTRYWLFDGGGSVVSLGPGSIQPSRRIHTPRHAISIFLGSTGKGQLEQSA